MWQQTKNKVPEYKRHTPNKQCIIEEHDINN